MVRKEKVVTTFMFFFFVVVFGHNDCEEPEYNRCLKNYLSVFQNGDSNLPLTDIYCSAYKVIAQCFTSNRECVGEIIDFLRFLLLQHMIIDQKLGICLQTDLGDFEDVVYVDEKYSVKIKGLKNLEADKFSPCAAKITRNCAHELAKKLMSNGNICIDIKSYYTCYESSEIPCDSKILKDYVVDAKKGKELLNVLKPDLSCQSSQLTS